MPGPAMRALRSNGVTQLLAVLVLAAVVPSAGMAEVATASCRDELRALDRGFAASMDRLLRASTPAEQCIALGAQINAVARAVETQRRCRVPGSDVDRVVATLTASGDDFRRLHAQLGCSVAL